MDKTIELSGETISVTELKTVKALELVEALELQNYVTFIQCVREPDGGEVVVFDTEVEVPQKRVHDIHRLERLAVRFEPQDKSLPDTFALRADFPEVPHLNMRPEEYPRSLCIFEAPYSEVKLHWTAPFYIRKVREWLALTARGELHAEDQPLEPLLYGSEGYLILPQAVLDMKNPIQVLVIDRITEAGAQKTYMAKAAASLDAHQDEVQLLITTLCAAPQTHGLIHSKPKNLLELHDYLESVGLDLLGHLHKQMRHWKKDPAFGAVKNAKLIILVLLPKLRDADDTAFENVELRAFVTEHSIVEIGGEIGIWGVIDGEIGLLFDIDPDKTGEGVQLEMLNPILDFSIEKAASQSGLTESTDIQIATVGVGSLGSQVVLNLIRMGYGRWILIDDDILLPHNLARHALTKEFVGHSKAVGLAILAHQMIYDPAIAQPYIENILQPSKPDSLKGTLSNTQVILDISTSIAVARYLTHDVDSSARRISLFLNPTASDVVILAEDDDRIIKLDMLEMQYYRELIQNPDLQGHLRRGDERLRYGTSCRDLSSTIPQDLVAHHSAICSRVLRKIIEDRGAASAVWSTDPVEMTTQKYVIPISQEIRREISGWTIVADELILEKISQMRVAKLPNETGGVLIGSYDTARKIVYVIDTIPAPPDSVEWPTVFIRGAKGLKQQVQQIQIITDKQLDYVGEWHSHPPGTEGNPSEDDIKAFEWLSKIMADDGLPALMVIAADDENTFYLGQMGKG